MRRLVLLASVLLAAAAASPALAADSRVIAPGVSAGGVDLSNLTVDQAAAKLREALAAPLGRAVTVTAGAGTFRLWPSNAGVKLDAVLTARRAYYAGANRPAGDTAPVAVTAAVTHSSALVKTWIARISRAVTHPARDATVRITLRHLSARHSRPGRTLAAAALTRAVGAALDDPASARSFTGKVVPLAPRVTYRDLLREYGTVVTIDRAHYTLRLFKGLKIAARYPIAVGMAGLETPAGMYAIHDKTVNPAWHVPRSPWAGSLGGTTVAPGDPNNPIKARWLGIADGVGIHGTSEDWSVGHSASHGCIRMHVRDVIALYPRVPVGTPVLIK
jgi:lipoprotein-anchoring transpeptidase ErfK/SrfK